jgi:hypothetical protein
MSAKEQREKKCQVPGCEKIAKNQRSCSMHQSRIYKTGCSELRSYRELLVSYVPADPNTGCWNWTKHLSGGGYGAFKIEGIMRPAHRVSYELFWGEIPDGLQVCHRCDNKRCINPDHLFLGTQKDNIADCIKKGRMKFQKNRMVA